MSDAPANPSTPANTTPSAPPSGGLSRKWTFGILALCFLFVIMPYLFWQATWFGKPLTDEEIAKNLTDREQPRKTQHALAQIADAIIRKDATVKRWYPSLPPLAAHPVDEIRVTAAWVMGQDNSVPEFREALRTLLGDANPMVRRNAALGLVRFADAAGHGEIVAMLHPFTVPAPYAGTLAQRLKPGDAVNPGTLIARISVGQEEKEVRCPVPGALSRWLTPDNAAVSPPQPIAEIEPDATVVWEALRALVLIGQPADVPAVEMYLAPRQGFPEQVRTQARQTLAAIHKRVAP